ncbi:hypothetical protein J4416_03360 [Candidatus Pacearchaeota archaeon]|nr:hypothetical protein [Candidatus Pacearchaeota archaeon]
MSNFVRIKEEDRIKIFNDLKKEIGIPWREFYFKFKISKGSFFNYLSGRNAIPEELFNSWSTLARINIRDKNIISKPSYKKKIISNFKLDKDLAEILGVLNGDGHVSKFKYEICVVGSILERDYYNYLKMLFEKKFGTQFTLREEGTKFKLRLYSKELSNRLVKYYGLPKGNKIGKLSIYSKLWKSKNMLKRYIRGLYDTDGCFHIRRKNDPMISITSADSLFLQDIIKALNYLGYNTAKGNQRVFIYRKKDVNMFFKEIEPSNSKHLKKYRGYSEQASIA